jgi:alkanesulfonate monooxygenase SsuD/methylene tetrahydromethanopterin reductase-like flavin-dependent oxidoreductase (luciferase family)
MITDYEQAGIPYDRPGVRIDRFVEGLAIIKGCWARAVQPSHGEHYTITGYDGLPKPVQAPVRRC